MKFALGRTVATPGALNLMHRHAIDPDTLLHRHVNGDWGDMPPEDKAINEEGLRHEGRLMSSYPVGDGKVWIITEWDRSTTTLLLPDDY